MAQTGLEVFDTTIQRTNAWLKQVAERLAPTPGDDRHRAYTALRGTLHALRDRMTPDQAAHLGAQLPMLVRGIYYEGWRPAETPRKERLREEFLAHVAEAFRKEPDVDAEEVARAVFAVLARELDPGEVGKVIATMPEAVRGLWPEHMVDAAMQRVQQTPRE